MILDVNMDYFEQHGGYKFAREFYKEAYRFACKLYGRGTSSPPSCTPMKSSWP